MFKVLALDFDGPVVDLFHGFDKGSLERDLERLVSNYKLNYTAGTNAYNIFDIIEHSNLNGMEQNRLLSLAHDRITKAERKAFKTAIVYNESFSAIKKLLSMGINICIVTGNDSRLVKKFFEENYLGQLDVYGRNMEEIHFRKPNPFNLEYFTRHCHCSSSDALVVGNAYVDFKLAERLNCDFMAIYPEHDLLSKVSDVSTINSLLELVDLE